MIKNIYREKVILFVEKRVYHLNIFKKLTLNTRTLSNNRENLILNED